MANRSGHRSNELVRTTIYSKRKSNTALEYFIIFHLPLSLQSTVAPHMGETRYIPGYARSADLMDLVVIAAIALIQGAVASCIWTNGLQLNVEAHAGGHLLGV
jgi:hypothetical protein